MVFIIYTIEIILSCKIYYFYRYAETSAANGEGVSAMFDAMLKAVCDKQGGAAKGPVGGLRNEAQTSEIYHKQMRS